MGTENVNLERVRWPGSGSNPSGLTPFGFYDPEPDFINDAPRMAAWAATRLGYPETDVEMVDINFYACFEEAINEYSALVNLYNIKDNIFGLVGTSTKNDVTQKVLTGNPLPHFMRLAEAYGTPIGVGGNVDHFKRGIEIQAGKQDYDLQWLHDCNDLLEPTPTITGSCITTASIDETVVGGASGSYENCSTTYTSGSVEFPVWTINSGKIPNGMYLKCDGTLGGTPTEDGIFDFVLQVYVTPTEARMYPYRLVIGEIDSGEAGGTEKKLLPSGSIYQPYNKQFCLPTDYSNPNIETKTKSRRIEVTRIFHYDIPAINRSYGNFKVGSEALGYEMFGYYGGSYEGDGVSSVITYTMNPLFDRVIRAQAVEFHDQIRRSAYSFELVNNKLRIFPIPDRPFTLWFEYYYQDELEDTSQYGAKAPDGSYYRLQENDVVSDMSNVPYTNIPYSKINSVGRQWIRSYFLALCKENLGLIRGKYGNIPIPGQEITLNSDTLLSQAESEKSSLIERLREDLESMRRKTQIEEQSAIQEQTRQGLSGVPLFLYVK